jgi:hypothetical protein
MSQDNPVAEATISDEELELDLTPDGTESEDELKQKLANAEKAKKQILARARKAETELKAHKDAQIPTAEPVQQSSVTDDTIWKIAEYIQQGYTRQDAEFIQKNGGDEALKDPNSLVSLALKTVREQRAAERAASEVNTTSGMTDIERKYTTEQLQNMTAAELEKILPRADS